MIHLISLSAIMNAKDLRLVEDYENEEFIIETTTFSETTESEEIDIETTTLSTESGWYLWQPGSGYGQGNGQWYNRPPWIIGPGPHHKEPSGYFGLPYSPTTLPSITTTTSTKRTSVVPPRSTIPGFNRNRCLSDFVDSHCDLCTDGYHGDKCQYSGKASKIISKLYNLKNALYIPCVLLVLQTIFGYFLW